MWRLASSQIASIASSCHPFGAVLTIIQANNPAKDRLAASRRRRPASTGVYLWAHCPLGAKTIGTLPGTNGLCLDACSRLPVLVLGISHET